MYLLVRKLQVYLHVRLLEMKPSFTAVVSSLDEGTTGGEQYNARLLKMAKQAGFHISYISWQDSFLDKVMGLPVLWRWRFMTRTLMLHWLLWRSSGDVFMDVWLAPYVQYWARHTSRHITLMVHHLRGELEHDAHVQTAEKTLVRAASQILTVSQSSQRQIRSLCIDDVPITIIPPGFERTKCMPKPMKKHSKQVQLLFVGHMTKAKGILDLLEAVALLQRDSYDLHVVGGVKAEPETWHMAKSLIQKHGLSDRVHMYGRVEDEALQKLYQQADLFVLPSYWEGYGIVFLEAMSMGLPVISTTAGAIPEVVSDQHYGLLLEAGDVQALHDALYTLIHDPVQRHAYATCAQKAADHAADWTQIERSFLTWWKKRAHDAC